MRRSSWTPAVYEATFKVPDSRPGVQRVDPGDSIARTRMVAEPIEIRNGETLEIRLNLAAAVALMPVVEDDPPEMFTGGNMRAGPPSGLPPSAMPSITAWPLSSSLRKE